MPQGNCEKKNFFKCTAGSAEKNNEQQGKCEKKNKGTAGVSGKREGTAGQVRKKKRPAVPGFFCALTLLCSFFVFFRTCPAVRLFFYALTLLCQGEKGWLSSRYVAFFKMFLRTINCILLNCIIVLLPSQPYLHWSLPPRGHKAQPIIPPR